jgi:LPS export ABC transporter permease LptG/LPS export ABC transporter permease LptF
MDHSATAPPGESALPLNHRKPGITLYLYAAREALRPFLFALVGLTLIVLTRDLIVFSELIINRGIGADQVALIAFFEAVPVASEIYPFSVLIGALVALGRLGADREILALEASGVAAPRLVWPIACFTAITGVASVALSLWGVPSAGRTLDATLERIGRQQPWANFRAGVVNRFGGWQVEAREVSAQGDVLRGVLLWSPDVGETIFAGEGRVAAAPDGSVALTLEDGTLVLSARGGAQQLRFETMVTELPGSDQPIARVEEKRIQSLSLEDLWIAAHQFTPTPAEPLPRAEIELHRRFATPVATVMFGFLAVPLFLMRRNFSRSGGSVLGLLVTIGYFVVVQFGEGLIQAGTLGVGAGVWLPNAVLALLSGALLLRVRQAAVLGHAFDRPQLRVYRPVFLRAHAAGKPRAYALPIYITERFVQLVAIAFGVLLVAYLLIDVMERLDWFAKFRATGIEVLRFYAVRIPLLASRVVPMALLVGAALVVSLLAVEGELIGMRACGIAAPYAFLPVLILSVLVAPAYFVLRNVVVPRTNLMADELKQTEIKAEYYRKFEERQKMEVWRRSGSRLLEAARFDPEYGFARKLTIYEIGEDGIPVARSDARIARHIGRGIWRLSGSRRVEIRDGEVHEVPARMYANLGEVLPADLDTMHLSIGALAKEIEVIEADGYDATPLRVDYHVKLADALACILLPASVLFFAVGGPPFPGPAQTLLVSGVLGVGFIMVTAIGASLGYGGTVPPFVGGWAPTITFTAIAGFLAFRIWRRM